jgi:hypothetical protein
VVARATIGQFGPGDEPDHTFCFLLLFSETQTMLAEAAKLAVEVAIATTGVRAVCCPVSEQYEIRIDRVGFGGMSTESEGVNGQAIRQDRSDARSLIVWPRDLVVGKFCYQPQHGDRWRIWLPSETVIEAECTAFPPEPHWRWTDRFQTAYRIHIKVMKYGQHA